MSNVTVPQAQPNDEVTAELINRGPNAIAEKVNGQLDDDNISQLSGSKLVPGTLPASASDAASNVVTRMSESMGNFIASGAVWSATTALNGTMTAAVLYIAGTRVSVAAVASRGFTASKDTYVSISSTGS